MLCEAVCDGTALQAAECSVRLCVMVLPSRRSAMCASLWKALCDEEGWKEKSTNFADDTED